MEKAFWQNRWQEGKIGFHEGVPNQHLRSHFPDLSLKAGAHVFVPFCGKAVDLDWLLSKGFPVSGVEFNKEAVAEVFDRLSLVPEITEIRNLARYSSKGLVIWVGDFFELLSSDLGPVDAIYDRAALVALPSAMRERYARHLQSLCPSVPQLLVSFDYDQTQMDGPPFSVSKEHIHRLYDAAFEIEIIASADIAGPLAERCSGKEEAWLLRPIGSR